MKTFGHGPRQDMLKLIYHRQMCSTSLVINQGLFMKC